MTDLECTICHSRRFRPLGEAVDRMHHLEGRFAEYACHTCGLLVLHPQPDDATLARHYPETYYSYHDSARAQAPRTRVQKIAYYAQHPIQAANAVVYSKLLGQNRDLPVRAGARVLEVGCGDGRYLLGKRLAGAQCTGVDISAAALERLRERDPAIRTHCGDLWEAKFPDGYFDRVNLCNVLEHVRDPRRFLEEVRRILRPGALARIQVPNSASVTRHLFGAYWIHLDAPRHLFGFSPRNLRTILNEVGLHTVEWRTLENSYSVLGSILYAYHAVTGKKKPLARYERFWNSEIAKFLLAPYCLFVNALRAGDAMEFIVTKN